MVYIFFAVTFVLLLLSITSKPNTILNNQYTNTAILILLALSVTVNIVGRDIVSDTTQYVNWFLNMRNLDWSTARLLYPTDLLFFTIQWTLSKVTDSPTVLLFVIWILFLTCFLVFLRKLFQPWQLAVVFFTYICFSFFYSYTTVALRQGLALSFVFLALALFLTSENKVALKRIILLSIVASLFHWSAVPFAIIVLCFIFKKFRLKSLLFIWSGAAVLYITGLQEKLLSPVRHYLPMIDDYTTYSVYERYVGGVNRIDFLLFSAFWIVISLLLYKYLYSNKTYLLLIKLYIAFNTIYLLMGFVAFSDRIAGYSWMLIPVLVWYPIMNNQKYRITLGLVTAIVSLIVGIYSGKHIYLVPFLNSSSIGL